MTRSLLLGKFEPFDALIRLQNELERAFERPSSWFTTATTGRGAFPPANVFRGAEGYVVRFEIPGLPPEGISVEAQGDSLRVTGKRETTATPGTPHRAERWSADFSRTLQLPADADVARASANYKHGILNIDVPLRESAKARQIAVQH
jgi:HSP20 family protein